MTGNMSATQMVDTLVEHRLSCAPFTLQIVLINKRNKVLNNVTLQKLEMCL